MCPKNPIALSFDNIHGEVLPDEVLVVIECSYGVPFTVTVFNGKVQTATIAGNTCTPFIAYASTRFKPTTDKKNYTVHGILTLATTTGKINPIKALLAPAADIDSVMVERSLFEMVSTALLFCSDVAIDMYVKLTPLAIETDDGFPATTIQKSLTITHQYGQRNPRWLTYSPKDIHPKHNIRDYISEKTIKKPYIVVRNVITKDNRIEVVGLPRV